MFKKVFALSLAIVMLFSVAFVFSSCEKTNDSFKVGFIFLHDENSTYDLNFINAAKAMQKALGLSDDQVILKTNIAEGEACYEAAVDLVNKGCTLVFADSFGHED